MGDLKGHWLWCFKHEAEECVNRDRLSWSGTLPTWNGTSTFYLNCNRCAVSWRKALWLMCSSLSSVTPDRFPLNRSYSVFVIVDLFLTRPSVRDPITGRICDRLADRRRSCCVVRQGTRTGSRIHIKFLRVAYKKVSYVTRKNCHLL